MARPKAIIHGALVSTLVNLSSNGELVRVVVGPEQKEFLLNKELLSAASPFFLERLDTASQLSSLQKPQPVWLPQRGLTSIWLSSESPAMFELFVAWLRQPSAFRRHVDDLIAVAATNSDAASQRLHWSLVRLHLFCTRIGLHHLQDTAIDAIQDLYLRCDWDATPRFVRFLYGQCEAVTSMRLRRWTVAMVAWSLAGGSEPSREGNGPARFNELFVRYPEFATEYLMHVRKMKAGKLDARIKNPQLRIPANKLRSEERQFGFRQCSFHSHRAAVGEKRCPHSTASMQFENHLPLPPLVAELKFETGIAVLNPLYPQDVPKPLRRMKSVGNVARF